MNTGEQKANKKAVTVGIIIYAILFFAIVLISNLDKVNTWLGSILMLLRPVLIGLGLAYICNPFFRFFERKLFCRLRPPALRRTISLICTYLTILLIIVLVLLLIIPQLIESIVAFAQSYNEYVSSAIGQINKLFASINNLAARFTDGAVLLNYLDVSSVQQAASNLFGIGDGGLMDILKDINIKPIAAVLESAVSLITDSLFGVFISLYLLSTKEKRYAQIMKLRRALFSDTANAYITRICTIADRSFGGFIEGKLVDSLIIGILTYITISIFQIPYAILIATFVGLTNIIPVIGPFIGAIPTAIIILLSDPAKVIPFFIIIVVIQQIDGNIIGPKILGSNTGVSSLCVIIAVTTMGSLWGLVGMLLGVPLFATVLDLVDTLVVSSLQKKGLPSGVENYYAGDVLVDPLKNAHPVTDKIAQTLEKSVLRIRNKTENGEEPTKWEQIILTVYKPLHKHKLINELSDEGQARFAAQEALKTAAAEAEALYAELHPTPVTVMFETDETLLENADESSDSATDTDTERKEP